MRTHLREMTPEDVPAVLERLREQNERDGTSYAMPQVFDEHGARLPNIPLALVAVTDDGEVRQGHVFEKTVEQMTFGIDREATVCSMHEQDAVLFILRNRGYRDMHLFVPVLRVEQMQHGLEKIYGMNATDGLVKHFYRLLDPAENDALRAWYESQEVTK